MEAYYRNLLAGQGRATALREAMRALRATQPHPHYWAPFIALGRDAPLRSLPSINPELPGAAPSGCPRPMTLNRAACPADHADKVRSSDMSARVQMDGHDHPCLRCKHARVRSLPMSGCWKHRRLLTKRSPSKRRASTPAPLRRASTPSSYGKPYSVAAIRTSLPV